MGQTDVIALVVVLLVAAGAVGYVGYKRGWFSKWFSTAPETKAPATPAPATQAPATPAPATQAPRPQVECRAYPLQDVRTWCRYRTRVLAPGSPCWVCPKGFDDTGRQDALQCVDHRCPKATLAPTKKYEPRSTPSSKTSPMPSYAGHPKPLKSSPASAVPGLARTGPSKDMYPSAVVLTAGAPPGTLALRTANRAFTRGDGKRMMARSVDDAWPAIKKYFALEDWQKERFVALMLGQSTRESTLCVDVETGTGKGWGVDSAHAYGLLQTAVTAFKGANPSFDQEDDVPEMRRYAWKAENFLDPMISNFMGIRKMCHFALEARAKYGQTDPRAVLRLAVQGHNLGHANPGNDAAYMADYPDNVARMGEWYWNGGHAADEAFTWTGNFDGKYPATSYARPIQGGNWSANWDWFWNRQVTKRKAA